MRRNPFENHMSRTIPPKNGMHIAMPKQIPIIRSSGKLSFSCETCGLNFEKHAAHAKRVSRHYCSRACSNAGKITKVKCVCVMCGSEFLQPKQQAIEKRIVTCSEACKRKKKSLFLLDNESKRAKELNKLRKSNHD